MVFGIVADGHAGRMAGKVPRGFQMVLCFRVCDVCVFIVYVACCVCDFCGICCVLISVCVVRFIFGCICVYVVNILPIIKYVFSIFIIALLFRSNVTNQIVLQKPL